jgi:hypothetical protein
MKTVSLYFKGTEKDLNKLLSLRDQGELTKIIGHEILDIRECDVPNVPSRRKLKRFSWIRSLYQTLIETFSVSWQPILATAFGVSVLVVSLVLLWPKNPIDSAFQTIHANNTSEMIEELRDFQFTWETTEQTSNLAFSPTQKQPTLATKAFGAGLLTGRETLLGKRDVVLPSPLLPPVSVDNWSNTEWKIYFDFGRWTFLLWTASQFQPPEPQIFWDEQRQIFAHFKTAFVERAEAKKDGEARDLLDTQLKKRVQPFLDKLPDSSISDEFGFKLENMMDFLAADL